MECIARASIDVGGVVWDLVREQFCPLGVLGYEESSDVPERLVMGVCATIEDVIGR